MEVLELDFQLGSSLVFGLVIQADDPSMKVLKAIPVCFKDHPSPSRRQGLVK